MFMSEPEIARRCVGCGAAVRGVARVCPHCGHDAGVATAASPTPVAPWEQLRAESKLPPPTVAAPDDDSAGIADEAEYAPADDVPLSVASSRSESLELQPPLAVAASRVAATARSERVRQRAAVVGENLRPHVERLRDASIVVIDEASDDPGLRFVLVALLLFGLFLLFLVLSFVLA